MVRGCSDGPLAGYGIPLPLQRLFYIVFVIVCLSVEYFDVANGLNANQWLDRTYAGLSRILEGNFARHSSLYGS